MTFLVQAIYMTQRDSSDKVDTASNLLISLAIYGSGT